MLQPSPGLPTPGLAEDIIPGMERGQGMVHAGEEQGWDARERGHSWSFLLRCGGTARVRRACPPAGPSPRCRACSSCKVYGPPACGLEGGPRRRHDPARHATAPARLVPRCRAGWTPCCAPEPPRQRPRGQRPRSTQAGAQLATRGRAAPRPPQRGWRPPPGRPTPPTELTASATACLNGLPAVKRTTRRAGMAAAAPVFGLRPMRARLART